MMRLLLATILRRAAIAAVGLARRIDPDHPAVAVTRDDVRDAVTRTMPALSPEHARIVAALAFRRMATGRN
jgi:hypothetical protein